MTYLSLLFNTEGSPSSMQFCISGSSELRFSKSCGLFLRKAKQFKICWKQPSTSILRECKNVIINSSSSSGMETKTEKGNQYFIYPCVESNSAGIRKIPTVSGLRSQQLFHLVDGFVFVELFRWCGKNILRILRVPRVVRGEALCRHFIGHHPNRIRFKILNTTSTLKILKIFTLSNETLATEYAHYRVFFYKFSR